MNQTQTPNAPFTLPKKRKKTYWDNKINYRFRFGLQKKGDADIIVRLAEEENKSGFIRDALRYYVQHEDEILAAANHSDS